MTDGTDSWGRVFLCAASGDTVAYTTTGTMRMQGNFFKRASQWTDAGTGCQLLVMPHLLKIPGTVDDAQDLQRVVLEFEE